MSDDWDKPSEKLRALADAPEPAIRPLSTREKDRIVGAAERHIGDQGEIGEQGEPPR